LRALLQVWELFYPAALGWGFDRVGVIVGTGPGDGVGGVDAGHDGEGGKGGAGSASAAVAREFDSAGFSGGQGMAKNIESASWIGWTAKVCPTNPQRWP
jgi:hypothetical protein